MFRVSFNAFEVVYELCSFSVFLEMPDRPNRSWSMLEFLQTSALIFQSIESMDINFFALCSNESENLGHHFWNVELVSYSGMRNWPHWCGPSQMYTYVIIFYAILVDTTFFIFLFITFYLLYLFVLDFRILGFVKF